MKSNIRYNIKKILSEYTVTISSDWDDFTYEGLNSYLGNRTEKKIANNTTIRRLSSGEIAIKYHYTDILTVNILDNIKVKTGGWNTRTTIDRLNQLLPKNVHLYTKKGNLFIKGANGTFEFVEGMIVTQNGDVLG